MIHWFVWNVMCELAHHCTNDSNIKRLSKSLSNYTLMYIPTKTKQPPKTKPTVLTFKSLWNTTNYKVCTFKTQTWVKIICFLVLPDYIITRTYCTYFPSITFFDLCVIWTLYYTLNAVCRNGAKKEGANKEWRNSAMKGRKSAQASCHITGKLSCGTEKSSLS